MADVGDELGSVVRVRIESHGETFMVEVSATSRTSRANCFSASLILPSNEGRETSSGSLVGFARRT
jgi:hypothetical protein